MQFASLGSGSAGNSFVVKQNKSLLMVDCGFAIQDVISRLDRLNETPENITGILLTNEHEDHVKGAFKLANKFKSPIWLSYGTFKMCEKHMIKSYEIDFHMIDSHNAFEIEDFTIQPFPVPHDAREPTQFTLSDGKRKLGILTDTGTSTPHIENMLQQLDAHAPAADQQGDRRRLGQQAREAQQAGEGGKAGGGVRVHLDPASVRGGKSDPRRRFVYHDHRAPRPPEALLPDDPTFSPPRALF